MNVQRLVDVTVNFCRRSLVCLRQARKKLTKTRNPELETRIAERSIYNQKSRVDLTPSLTNLSI